MKSEKSFKPRTGFSVHDHNDAKPLGGTTRVVTRIHIPRHRDSAKTSAVQLENHTVPRNQTDIDSGHPFNKSSTSKRHPGLSDAGRPSVPRRTSSVNLKPKERRSSRTDLIQLHRQSCLLFSSLDSSIAEQRDLFVAQGLVLPQDNITALPPSIDSITTSNRSSFVGSAFDETPLGFTMARKETSLPSISDCQESHTFSQRDSRMSFRSSFLSSFPEPPVTPVPALPSLGHLRNTSKYHVFPQQRQRTPTPPSPITENRPPITTTDSYSSNPNLNQDLYTQNPTSPTSISWTSPATRQAEYAKIDRAQCHRQKVLRKLAPKWLCGSLGGERGKFHDDDDGQRSVRRFRMDRPGDQVEEEAFHRGDHDHDYDRERASSDGKPSGETIVRTRNSSTSQLIDEKKTVATQTKKAKSTGWARFVCF